MSEIVILAVSSSITVLHISSCLIYVPMSLRLLLDILKHSPETSRFVLNYQLLIQSGCEFKAFY